MVRPRDPLEDDAIRRTLAREHERAQQDEGRLASARPRIEAARAAGRTDFGLYPKDVYLAVSPAMGRFLYLAARAIGARRIVEFGASFGISTIYLAAAAKEAGGNVVTTELEPSKAARARANLAEAGLDGQVEIRVGDALETLKDVRGPVDLLFLDGWKEAYLPVLQLVQPALRPGACVLADNISTFPDELRSYVASVNRLRGPYRSTSIPFPSGLEYSIHTGDRPRADWPAAETGGLAGIARKNKRRAPMETLSTVRVTATGGLDGDNRGRFRDRAVTVLSKEGWTGALSDLDPPADLPWTARRANLLTEGVSLPRAAGGVIRVGNVLLETTGQTSPCSRMEEQHPGLLKALSPDWRGGVTCRVLQEGELTLGDTVQVLLSPAEKKRPRLPA